MERKELKPGDKVWLFDADHQKIVSERVIKAAGDAVVVGSFKNVVGMFCLGFDCFPSREALCEHYRKIFE